MTMEEQTSTILSQEDWSLHRQGQDDQKRHQEKVNEAIKDQLPELITEESIVMSNGKQVVKIPIRSLDEYKIKYNYDKKKHVGQGNGDSQVGDLIAKGKPEPGQGAGEGAGEQAGVDYVEAEVSLLEVEEALFKELALPNLKQKEETEEITKDIEFNDIRNKGLTGNIDKKKTMMSAFKRNAMAGTPQFNPILPEDLRFRTWNESIERETKAVVLAIMDTSGSMGAFEKYVARSFFFWLTRFLRFKYDHVELRFIAHHTEAKEVEEETFFSKGESGGTICSSAYRKALELIQNDYPTQRYNIYAFHFSDGDNLTSDNQRCLPLIEELARVCNLFGYGEVNQYQRQSSLMSIYKKIPEEELRYFILRRKSDVFFALKHFLREEE
ncbi:sporulation protein YhbH [Jeotgalibacillus proteolyticus]|uniref:Sporulation protein YhbH n=1 Tax=Jeotgalibacillus proteolyticus TaxID=2082395 RepID=A0A2S5GHK0_9BACL|nr:sporulation protein YhbH [Jeotgalibacillus proteolyticus]PPA72456.1 sporulation protein YhbH [Jeotgalibacillus proteolyticus]